MVEEPASIGTTNYLIDELKYHLSKVVGVETRSKEDKELKQHTIFGDRKYYNQAFDLLRIGAYKPVPYFIINLSDLSEELRKELSSLDKQSRQFVLKQTIGRIFEDVNSDLFHKSISRVLQVKFEK
jgi:hypothetical protein